MADLNLFFVIGAALVDSINPCAFGVLIFLLAYLSKVFKNPKHMLVNGLVYIFAVFLTYLVAGLILLPFIRKLGAFSVVSYYVLATIIAIAGLIELKDAFWSGRGFSLQIFPNEAIRIKKYIKRVGKSLSCAFSLGVFVALVELPCTGFAYLAVLGLISLSGLSINNWMLLIIYNLIFVFPLVIILLLVEHGMSTTTFKQWKDKHKNLMRLATGIVLLILATVMIAYIEFGTLIG